MFFFAYLQCSYKGIIISDYEERRAGFRCMLLLKQVHRGSEVLAGKEQFLWISLSKW